MRLKSEEGSGKTFCSDRERRGARRPKGEGLISIKREREEEELTKKRERRN